MDKPSQNNPIFVCGVSRSGTSYLRTILNSANGVYLSFEGRMIKEGILLYERHKKPISEKHFLIFLEQLIKSEKEEPKNIRLIETISENKAHLYKTWQINQSFIDVMAEIYRLSYNKPIWGDKLLRIEYAWVLQKVWPNARFIIIHRDPRAVAASRKVRWKMKSRLTAGYWNTHTKLAEQLAKEVPNKVHLMHYEKLIENPISSLLNVLKFIDADASEAESIIRNNPPKPKSLNKWRNTLSKKEIKSIESFCFSGMDKLGYQTEIATEIKKIPRLGYLIDNLWYHKSFLLRPTALYRKRPWQRLLTMFRNASE